MPQIEKAYITTGKLKYVSRDFPLEAIHQQARKAAEAFWCAEEQGKGREMHQRLFANQRQLQPDALVQHAEALGLSTQTFRSCLDSGKYTGKINASLQDGGKVGVTGTPAFLLGYTQADGMEVRAVTFLSGAQPFSRFKEQIDKLLEVQN